jgi:PAS domain S-box-containing protein
MPHALGYSCCMSTALQNDFLPESFFTDLYPQLDAPSATLAAAPTEPPTPQPHRPTDPLQTERLQLMVEHLRDGAVFFLDADGRVADWPASAQRLLGHAPETVVGQGVEQFDACMADVAGPDTLLALERATLLGQYEATGWRARPDGSTFWSQLVVTALHRPTAEADGGGELLGYACWLRDMTDVKRLEDLLRQLNQNLELRVQERTQQLQEINRDLESFSYSVSHDLRAPLRHIGSFVEMLRDELGEASTARALRHLDTIAQSAEHMGQLIEGLLAFSRLGRAPLTLRALNMGSLVQSSLNRVQHDPSLQRPPSELQWQLPDHWPEVRGDALLLSQVWDNLLSNALKYSRKRELAQIELGWNAQPAEAPTELVFWVRDNGAGFDPKRADKLFGVFQRLHRATEFEGTGIGLALCRRIVERHGGRIWAESTPQVGSTFCFALPASSSPPADNHDSTL